MGWLDIIVESREHGGDVPARPQPAQDLLAIDLRGQRLQCARLRPVASDGEIEIGQGLPGEVESRQQKVVALDRSQAAD